MESALLPIASCCHPLHSTSVDDVVLHAGGVSGEESHAGTDMGMPSPRDQLKLCAAQRFCKVHSETVFICVVQFF